jgi:hypothetical protein
MVYKDTSYQYDTVLLPGVKSQFHLITITCILQVIAIKRVMMISTYKVPFYRMSRRSWHL